MSKIYSSFKEDFFYSSKNAFMNQNENNRFDQVELVLNLLPDFNFDEISIQSDFLDYPMKTPFFTSGITNDFEMSNVINDRIASCCSSRGWILNLDSEFTYLKIKYPNLKTFFNISILDLIEIYNKNAISEYIKSIEEVLPQIICIHFESIGEWISRPIINYRGAYNAIKEFKHTSKVPIMIKSSGTGMNEDTILKIKDLNLFAIDVGGFGENTNIFDSFQGWGISTLESLLNSEQILSDSNSEIWASSTMRNGVDAAKAISLGAKRVGFYKPILEAAIKSEKALNDQMINIENELMISMLCTGAISLYDLNSSKIKGFK